ncbi:hypothetical protein N4G65_50450, partial [Streptomyces fulvoviolaceus]|nr:hypothetical protein [Streptomyces fulvoviolaceus]
MPGAAFPTDHERERTRPNPTPPSRWQRGLTLASEHHQLGWISASPSETRGIDVPDEIRERITGCDDPDLLRHWLTRAVTA